MQLSRYTIELLYKLGDRPVKDLLDKYSIHPRNQFHWNEDWDGQDPQGELTVSVQPIATEEDHI